jgi:hypothetical protein
MDGVHPTFWANQNVAWVAYVKDFMFINNINGCQPQANWCHPCLRMNEKYKHSNVFHWKLDGP